MDPQAIESKSEVIRGNGIGAAYCLWNKLIMRICELRRMKEMQKEIGNDRT